MPRPQATEAVIAIDAAGRFVDANDTALELLGVSLAGLKRSRADRFALGPAPEIDLADWRAEQGAGRTEPRVGTAGLRRADGATIRVAYALEALPEGFRARLWQIQGSPEVPATIHTVGDVLREWRAAERALAEIAPETAEWDRALARIDSLRGEYQALFREMEPRSEQA